MDSKFGRLLVSGLAAAFLSPPLAGAMEELPEPAANPPRYEIVPWTNGWHAALSDAEARGGHLAAITGGEEWLAVTRSFPPEELAGCWLGATDEETEGVWKWVTGEPWGYARWGAGEPNNDRGNADGCENFLEIKREPALHWNDSPGRGTGKTKYLLEREDGTGKTLSPRIPRKCGTPSRRCTATASAPEALVHRWSFNGDLADSVGGRDAVFSGSAAHSWSADGKSVSLPGGPWGTSALCLGKDVVPSDGTPVTIELWATQRQMQHQSRIFELASSLGNGHFGDFITMSWVSGDSMDKDEIWIWEAETNLWTEASKHAKFLTQDALAPYALGTEYHVSVVLEPDRDGRTFVRFAKRDAASGEILKQTNGWVSGGWTPARLAGREMWLGRSSFHPDNDAAADYDEVRIWNAALTDKELSRNARLGPDVLPGSAAVKEKIAISGNLFDGLVAYWPFDGDAKDASGNGNDGQVNGATLTMGRDGTAEGAYHFDGNDMIVVTDSESLRSPTNAGSIAVWFKPATEPDIARIWVIACCKGMETRQYGLGIERNNRIMLNDECGVTKREFSCRNCGPVLAAEEWHQIVITWDGANDKTYRDGIFLSSVAATGAMSANTEALYVGVDYPGGDEFYSGDLDDLAIWNRALSAEEVARLAAGEKPVTDQAAVGKGRYEIVPWTRGWEAAKADAEARGGHLATITSEEEWETVCNLFPLRDLLGCWLGASDAAEEGVWQWVTGEPWDFARWDTVTGQPDAMREGQDFLWLHVNYAGRWDDIEGNDPGATKYLLEREGTPQISVSGLRPAFSLSPHALSVEAAGGTHEVEVSADDAWSATERVPWISLRKAHGKGPGKLLVKVAANESPEARSAKVRVRTTWSGEWRDIAVEQRGMEQVAPPRILPRRGAAFEGTKQRVVLSCATEGATIRFTLDGREPDATSPAYAGSFNIAETATVKAKAFQDGMLPSATVEAAFTRRTSLAEALGLSEGTVSTDRFAGWRVDGNAGRGGAPAARSGAVGPDGRSRMELRVEGAGTVAFWWKVSCEDDPDGMDWDRAVFSVDGIGKAAIDGESGWQRVEAQVRGEGVHVLAWEYAKDWFDETSTADVAWVGEVSWSPIAKRVGKKRRVNQAGDFSDSNPEFPVPNP